MSRERTDSEQYAETVTVQSEGDVTDINPEDPVWGTDPTTGDETVSEADIDDVLYGEING